MMPACDLPPIASAVALGAGPLDPACLQIDLDLSGRGFAQIPDLGTARGFALQRSRAELGLRVSELGARMAFLVARSGGETGYIGIAGESLVPIVQIAEARWDAPGVGLAVAAGLVDDPWVGLLEEASGHAETLVVMEVDQDFVPRADVGGWVSWTGPGSRVSATASLTTGEGYQRRERNGGADLTGVLHLRPIPADAPIALDLAVFAREGSRGLEQARDHRAGAAVIVRHDRVEGGVDGLLGWGLRGDGALLPAGVSVWGSSSDSVPVAALARVDVSTDDRLTPEARETTWLFSGGSRLPFRGEHRPGALTIGWEGRRWQSAAAPLAGAGLLRGADLLFVQLSVRLRAATPIEVW